MTTEPTLYTEYIGYWCDNCRTVWSWRPESGNCPECRTVPLRAADVTVAPQPVTTPHDETGAPDDD